MTEHLPALTFLGHSSVLLDIGGRRVLTDPILRQHVTFLARLVVPLPPSLYADVDLVLISHLHHDHCDLPSLRMLGMDVPILAPAGSGEWLRSKGFLDVHELVVGETYVDGVLSVRAVTAVHDGKREPFGPRAAAIGFLVSGGPVRRASTSQVTPTSTPRWPISPTRSTSLCCRSGAGVPTSGPGISTPRGPRRPQASSVLGSRSRCTGGRSIPYGLRRALPSRLYDPSPRLRGGRALTWTFRSRCCTRHPASASRSRRRRTT